MNKVFERNLEKVVEGYLEDYSFEEFLENFNVTPVDAFKALFEAGLIDEDVLEAFLTSED